MGPNTVYNIGDPYATTKVYPAKFNPASSGTNARTELGDAQVAGTPIYDN